MNSGRLDKDTISQPELWKLALTVRESRLDVALFPPVTRQEMIWRTYPFDTSAAGNLNAIENVIYDNPLLLSDFKSVDCIIDNTPELLLPSALPSAQLAGCYDRSTTSVKQDATDPFDIETFATGDPDCCVAVCQTPGIRAFFTRTFYNVRFDSRLAALCRYFIIHRSGQHDVPEINVILLDNRLTLIATDSNRLLMANNFTFIKEIDAAYYILASISSLGLDRETVDVHISPAINERNDSLHNILCRFIPHTSPIPFPMLRYRASRQTLHAPFELITRPICE